MFAQYSGIGDFGGALVVANGASLSLNNGGDTVTLNSSAGTKLDEVTWGSEADKDQSITRQVDMDPAASFVKHSEAPLSGGSSMSPGRCSSGASFPGCGQ